MPIALTPLNTEMRVVKILVDEKTKKHLESLGVLVAFICLIVMKKTTMRGKAAPFIMELPSYHWPKFKALMIHLWDKAKHFVKKSFHHHFSFYNCHLVLI